MATFTRGPYPRVRPDRPLAVLSGLVGALLCLVIAAGCGGGSLSLDPVASAADRTLDKQTGRFTLAVKVTAAQAGSTTMDGTGSFDAKKQAAALTIDVPDITGGLMELRMLYPVTYVRLAGAPLPTSKSWIKVDLQKAANAFGTNLPQLGGSNPSPADALAQLRGSKDAKKLGTTTIDGVNTTHYRVRVDLDKALARATPRQRAALKRLVQMAKREGIDVVPTHADVWVGDDGLVRRFSENIGSVATIAMTFSDYGEPVQIDPPSADETIDLSG